MSGRRLGRRSIRVRVAAAFLAGAFVLAGFIAGSTYVLARAYLTKQRTDSVLRQSFNTLRFATEFEPGEQGSLEELGTDLHTRGTSDIVLVQAGRSVSSGVSVTSDTVPAALSRVVEGGGVAYALVPGEPRRLMFGSTIPGTDTVAYMAYALEELDATLGVLVRILVAVVAVAVVAAASLGLRLARLAVEPLRHASDAAQRVAEGLIDTRLDEAGDELGMLAVSFNRMAAALQERIAMERRFVADASHELRTPLTALRTSVSYLTRRPELPDALRSSAELAEREVLALQRLVDDLLELSTMEAGTVDVRTEPFDLCEFVRELRSLRARGAPVELDLPEDALVVRTDKWRLARIVGNLLENAVTHGGTSGVVVAVRLVAGRPTIAVSDAGPGIAREDLPFVFERFWRGDRARGRATGGSGLGLAIARDNATLLGAELAMSSEPGGGVVAVVTLPAGSMREVG